MVSDSPVSASVRRRWSLLPRRPWPALRPKSVHKLSTSAVTTRRWAPSQSTAGSSPDRRVTDLTPRSCPRSSRFVLGAERSCTARGTHSDGKRAISARRAPIGASRFRRVFAQQGTGRAADWRPVARSFRRPHLRRLGNESGTGAPQLERDPLASLKRGAYVVQASSLDTNCLGPVPHQL